MLCFPKQNSRPRRYVSVFLEYPEARYTPANLSPNASFKLIIKNHKDPAKDFAKDSNFTFTPDQVDWGFSQMLPLTDVNVDSGYLRADGAMVIRAELRLDNKRLKTSTVPALPPAQGVCADLLALLDQPGTTSDLTITAGDRSFPVHRAILAARCEYFRTLFDSGFQDSTSRTLDLPEADGDALSLLLRFIYGGVLDSQGCSRGLLKAALELADRLRLTQALELLCKQLADSVSVASVTEDLLLASRLGNEGLLSKLEAFFLLNGKAVDSKDLTALAEGNPQLMVRLLTASLRGTSASTSG